MVDELILNLQKVAEEFIELFNPLPTNLTTLGAELNRIL